MFLREDFIHSLEGCEGFLPDEMIAAHQESTPVSVRLNPQKASGLENVFPVENIGNLVAWCPNAFTSTTGPVLPWILFFMLALIMFRKHPACSFIILCPPCFMVKQDWWHWIFVQRLEERPPCCLQCLIFSWCLQMKSYKPVYPYCRKIPSNGGPGMFLCQTMIQQILKNGCHVWSGIGRCSL